MKDTQKNSIILPPFLEEVVPLEIYKKWLKRQADRHFKRDNIRWGKRSSREGYQGMIHEAVLRSEGVDAFTGQPMDWKLISQYRAGHKRANYRNLPTVDHTFSPPDHLTFEICSWTVNDCKNDLTVEQWLVLLENILTHMRGKKKSV